MHSANIGRKMRKTLVLLLSHLINTALLRPKEQIYQLKLSLFYIEAGMKCALCHRCYRTQRNQIVIYAQVGGRAEFRGITTDYEHKNRLD